MLRTMPALRTLLRVLASCTVGLVATAVVPSLAGATTVCPAGPPACDFANVQAAVDATGERG